MKIISLWSGPRNVSTALMYSFAQRSDTYVVDEPLYGHYLTKTDADHPGKQEVINNMETDGLKVIHQLNKQAKTTPILFLKNMAHHWIGLNDEMLLDYDNVFLIRDPREMLPSLVNQIPNPIMRDTGLKMQVDLLKKLQSQGRTPAVIDSRQLLLNPENTLKKLCTILKIKFEAHMLEWEAKPRKEDGVWAKHWYQNVHKSTGFEPYTKKKATVPPHVMPLLEECIPHYEYLYDNAIKLN
ncbi:sulfotransferase family protein [Fulvivirga lutimaris]|uniref:sulfotransferase-like domain-containing protein n=1 Tax=Fulvivirga lutimaris TaxID=1819566 RepID=UPI0012BC497E|nr:sulfotransferase family protein [Fulvivirga lutimaris]MTI41583.1 sulfotransferase family protein [Fulvivirga lutimaris]